MIKRKDCVFVVKFENDRIMQLTINKIMRLIV